MDNRSIFGLIIFPILILLLIFPSGCVPHGPTLYERSPHVVAVVIAPSPVRSGIQGMPGGKGESAGEGAGSAMKSLWSGCMDAGWGDGFGAVVVSLVCAGLTPIVGIGGAIAGASGASRAGDVERAKKGLEQNIPQSDSVVALFEQKLYAEHEGIAGHTFRSGKDFGLLERRPEGDYRDMATKGADGVLEVERFVVALSGKTLASELALRVCAAVKLTDTSDNSILYQAERCENGESARSIEAWSTDQWSAIKPELDVAIERLASNLAWYIFHGNKETIAAAPPGEKQVLPDGQPPK